MTCRCRSDVRPHPDQDRVEIQLRMPDALFARSGFKHQVHGIDACIADAVMALWEADVLTGESCCGHSQRRPEVVLEDHEDPAKARDVLRRVDSRQWGVLQRRLVEVFVPPKPRGTEVLYDAPPTRPLPLSEAVRREGYELVVGDPATRTDALGTYPGGGAVICHGDIIVCLGDRWDDAYSVSHEIAEHRHGFTHDADTAWAQCNLLARWHQMRTEPER